MWPVSDNWFFLWFGNFYAWELLFKQHCMLSIYMRKSAWSTGRCNIGTRLLEHGGSVLGRAIHFYIPFTLVYIYIHGVHISWCPWNMNSANEGYLYEFIANAAPIMMGNQFISNSIHNFCIHFYYLYTTRCFIWISFLLPRSFLTQFINLI